jgi:hypothetical protein
VVFEQGQRLPPLDIPDFIRLYAAIQVFLGEKEA